MIHLSMQRYKMRRIRQALLELDEVDCFFIINRNLQFCVCDMSIYQNINFKSISTLTFGVKANPNFVLLKKDVILLYMHCSFVVMTFTW